MHALLSFFGPKATPATLVLAMLIVPVAIWHHVHLVIHIVKHYREEKETKSDERD